MTTIVGLISYGRVWMGSDSLISDGMQKLSLPHPKTFVRYVGERPLCFGVAGSARISQLLEQLELPAYHKKASPRAFLFDLAEALRECLKDKGAGIEERGQQGGNFEVLVAFDGELFVIQSDFSILETRGDFVAVGSGQYYALGSLFSTEASPDPAWRLRLALMAAEHYDPGSGRPFWVGSI
ncbi:MAG: hypothetical protein KC441_12845 [Anaerolineales bacterium]|nr:hypothetical protein [Anaerolineales bacterium]